MVPVKVSKFAGTQQFSYKLAFMKTVGTLTFILFSTLIVGCMLSSSPKGDTGFADVEKIESLTGCFRNTGEGEEGKRYLSAAIWPGDATPHKQVTAIRVDFEKPSSLRVTAIGTGGKIKEQLFVEGKDFHLASGKIKTKSDPIFSFAYPAGNVFIGVGYETQVLGVDERGNARLQEAGGLAGTAFLIIPIAGYGRDAFIFPRIPDLCNVIN